MKVERAALIRAVRAPAAATLVYLALRLAFDRLSEAGGLLSPSGSPSLGFAALGVAVILLRLCVLFVVPMVIVWRLARLFG